MANDCYIARRPACGHVVLWMSDDLDKRTVEKEVAKAIRQGLAVEHAVTDEIRSQFCKCDRTLSLPMEFPL